MESVDNLLDKFLREIILNPKTFLLEISSTLIGRKMGPSLGQRYNSSISGGEASF